MKTFLTLLFLLLLSAALCGQVMLERSVIGSLGQSFEAPNVQISATAGEAMVTTQSASNLLLTQGFQQAEPEDLSSVSVVPLHLSELTVFPNPAYGQFQIRAIVPQAQEIHFEVWDASGRKISHVSQQMLANQPNTLVFDSTHWPPGLFLVRLLTASGALAGSARVLVLGQ